GGRRAGGPPRHAARPARAALRGGGGRPRRDRRARRRASGRPRARGVEPHGRAGPAMRRGAALRAATIALLAAALASCAPHLAAPPRLEPARVADRYRAARGAREALAAALDAEASAWLKGESLGDLPGVHARLALGAPDAFRVRVESLFGVALDFAAWGESLACYLPPHRVGMTMDTAADTLGVGALGPLGVRVLAATWEPPDLAWARAGYQDSVLVVRWEETAVPWRWASARTACRAGPLEVMREAVASRCATGRGSTSEAPSGR